MAVVPHTGDYSTSHHVFQFPCVVHHPEMSSSIVRRGSILPAVQIHYHEDELVAGMGVHVGKATTDDGWQTYALIAAHFVPQ